MRKLDPYEAAVAHLPALVPVGDAAIFLGIDRRTFRRWASSGKVKTLRTSPSGSGRVRVLRSELVRLLRSMGGAA